MASWWGPVAGWWSALLDRLRPSRLRLEAPSLYWTGPEGAATYGMLYRTQPHVRTVIDFLASQIAQLGLHVYRRVSDTDRVRVHDHPLARLLRAPNPGTTRYVFIAELVQDWCVYGNAFAVKVRRPGRLELYRVPAGQMTPHGDLIPRAYAWTLPSGETVTLDATEVFHLRDYHPDEPVRGLSRLETLRKLLAEDTAATRYREWFWSNGAKLSGWIRRPREAARWTEAQRAQFRDEWAQFQGPTNAGKTAVLEDGMEFVPVTATAREAELIPARKLLREEVTAAFHIPPAAVGILEAQGYGSVREQHRALYADGLGPLIARLEGEIMRQLLVEFADAESYYVEANTAEKLQGSFEEEQAALAGAVGAPYMSRNEARARLNLPRIDDPAYDQPVTRLDLAEGQQALGAAPALAAQAPPLVVVDTPPTRGADLLAVEVLAERVERAVRALPAAMAREFPDAASRRTVRLVRGADGRVAAIEDRGEDGAVLGRAEVVRDGAGRVQALTSVPGGA